MRKRKVLPFQIPASNKPLEVIPCTDGEKLIYSRFLGPAQAASQALTNAINNDELLLLEGLMAAAKLDANKGWKFNREKLRWERYLIPPEE